MGHCPSHDADRHFDNEERMEYEVWKNRHKPHDGLYSKFSVKKTEYIEHPFNEWTGVETEVNEVPLEVGSFVLVPFREDGSVRDEAALKALRLYARIIGGKLEEDVNDWIKNPTKYDWVNQPWED